MAKSPSARRPSVTPPSRRSVPPAAKAPRAPSASAKGGAAPAPRKVRGVAPWAARHAAKHAAEAAARNLEPPRPGSARATLRTPEQAETIKAQIAALHDALTVLRGLKRNLSERCYTAGSVLKRIRDERLFEAKGYGSFESFVEREVDLGSKLLAVTLARIPEVFTEEAADKYGLDPLLGALDALDRMTRTGARPLSRPPLLRHR
ncbi:MAG: hypothetical protein DIU78_011760 [Pseudomonadota bacterium]